MQTLLKSLSSKKAKIRPGLLWGSRIICEIRDDIVIYKNLNTDRLFKVHKDEIIITNDYIYLVSDNNNKYFEGLYMYSMIYPDTRNLDINSIGWWD